MGEGDKGGKREIERGEERESPRGGKGERESPRGEPHPEALLLVDDHQAQALQGGMGPCGEERGLVGLDTRPRSGVQAGQRAHLERRGEERGWCVVCLDVRPPPRTRRISRRANAP